MRKQDRKAAQYKGYKLYIENIDAMIKKKRCFKQIPLEE